MCLMSFQNLCWLMAAQNRIKKTKKFWIRIRNTELYTNPESRKRVAGSDVREPPDPGQVQDEVNTGPQHR